MSMLCYASVTPACLARPRQLAIPLPHEVGERWFAQQTGEGDAMTDGSRRKPGTTARARALRVAGNIAEACLWDELKDRKLGGYKFVRQYPIGPYFADFACRQARLVIEVDGSQHAESQSDRAREAFMCSRGYSVLRFWNIDVLKRTENVCNTVLAALDGRLAENVTATDLRFVIGDKQ